MIHTQKIRELILQRGNKGAVNALIACEFDPFMDDLAVNIAPRLRTSPVVRATELGDIDGVPLCFTDAAPCRMAIYCLRPWQKISVTASTTDRVADQRLVLSMLMAM